jgi:uncharacterized protein
MNKNLTAVIIGLSIIISVFVISGAYKYRYKTEESISVTGLGEKDFESDLVNWSASYNRKSTDLKTAYAQLKEDEKVVKDYLVSKGIKETGMLFSAVNVQRLEEDKYDGNNKYIGKVFAGYSLSQSVGISSKELDLVESVSRQITDLIEKGIELNSGSPSYYYSKLSELKIDLLAKASADAKQRAETIAKSAGGGLGNLKKANMGVFQIVGKNQNETYENGGTFNTSSRIKTASITVKTDYTIK